MQQGIGDAPGLKSKGCAEEGYQRGTTRAARSRRRAWRRFEMSTRLVLLRHATPTTKEEDAAQPLSTEGIAEAEFTAHALAASMGFDSRFGSDDTSWCSSRSVP